jgi:hypothetical protein
MLHVDDFDDGKRHILVTYQPYIVEILLRGVIGFGSDSFSLDCGPQI